MHYYVCIKIMINVTVLPDHQIPVNILRYTDTLFYFTP